MSELAIGNVREFRIPTVTDGERAIVSEAINHTAAPVERVEITPSMEAGIAEYATNYQTPYTDRQRAIAISVLKHSFFLPSGRHRRPSQ